jgi:hypothetical protein
MEYSFPILSEMLAIPLAAAIACLCVFLFPERNLRQVILGIAELRIDP